MSDIFIEKFWEDDTLVCFSTYQSLANIFNVGTAAAITASALDLKIVKYCAKNSMAVLNNLNIQICENIFDSKSFLNQNGVCFLNCERFFSNDLLSNLPIYISSYVFSCVKSEKEAENLINLLKENDTKRAIIVCGKSLEQNEISLSGLSVVYELKNNEFKKYDISAEKFGIQKTESDSLRGATPLYNAELVKDIFDSKIKGSKLDAVAINAGAMIYLSGCAKNFLQGIMKAYSVVDNGFVSKKLKYLQNHCR